MSYPAIRELAVFSAARQMPERERIAFLDEICAGDSALRRQIEELLLASADAGTFLEGPATLPLMPAPDSGSQPGGTIPPA